MLVEIFLQLLLFKNAYSFGEISAQKCQEYSKAVYVETASPILMPNSGTNRISECGIVSVPLIVGGTRAQIKEFPHMAVIGFGAAPGGNLAWNCGGSLISETFVLTAGHCLEDRNVGPAQGVKLGAIDLNTPDTSVQEKMVIERIPHPEYRPPKKYNDIGLLRLNSPVIFNAFVRPACLNIQGTLTESSAIATGFGKLSYDSGGGSPFLMKVSLNLMPNQNCATSYASERILLPQGIQDSMLCAGDQAGGKDTCQGDSGGPLQTVLSEPYCMYNLIGVTSFGKFCGFANSPAIYTRVSSYIPWIEKVVWGWG